MTTEATTTNQLPPCPLPDCKGSEHHYHDIDAYDVYAVSEGHDCATEARFGFRCYGPHLPGLSEPIDLPEITDEMVDRAVVTYVNTYYAYDAGSRRAAMRAALTEFRADLIAGIPQWQPIEPARRSMTPTSPPTRGAATSGAKTPAPRRTASWPGPR